jgi:hypothetical protein
MVNKHLHPRPAPRILLLDPFNQQRVGMDTHKRHLPSGMTHKPYRLL